MEPCAEILWPADQSVLTPDEYQTLWYRTRRAVLHQARHHQMDAGSADSLARVCLPLAAWLREQRGDAPLIVGVNGAQGSGKSTLCGFLKLILSQGLDCRVAVFSIDDTYKTRTERQRLAREVHPLFLTRGVPGTHDLGLALDTLQRLTAAGPATVTPIPRFDKAQDDRKPTPAWPRFHGRPEVILFEGWCIGARAETDAALVAPCNALERDEDPEGVWRRRVNDQLKSDYAELFRRLDRLIMLRVPGMSSVFEWRSLQERKLEAALDPTAHHRLMDEPALRRFIMHYERLTRHMLREMPERADLVLSLDEHHHFTEITSRH